MKRLLPLILGIAVVIGVGVAFAKNAIARGVVIGGVKALTGLQLELDQMDVGVLKTFVGMRGLKLHNPQGFSDPIMVDIPEVLVDYDLGAFLRGQTHLETVRLYLKELVIVKNAEGQVNLHQVTALKQSAKEPAPSTPKPAEQPSAPGALRIDSLWLKVGTVTYKDYSKGSTPSVKAFPINTEQQYSNITNPQVLVALITSQAIMHTALARLPDMKLPALEGLSLEQFKAATGAVGEMVGKTAKSASDLAGQALDSAGTTGKDLGDLGSKTLDTAKDTVGETTEAIKKLLPFGQ